jgi:hypothetical protein
VASLDDYKSSRLRLHSGRNVAPKSETPLKTPVNMVRRASGGCIITLVDAPAVRFTGPMATLASALGVATIGPLITAGATYHYIPTIRSANYNCHFLTANDSTTHLELLSELRETPLSGTTLIT